MEQGVELERAVSLLLPCLAPLGWETLSLSDGAGRVLAEDLIARQDFPAQSTAALEGYAVRSADLSGARSARPVHLSPGEGGTLAHGQAIAVSAGAPLPEGCDAVLPLADAQAEDGQIAAHRALWPYDNYIRRGEDRRRGDVLLPAGKRLTAPALAWLGDAGYATVQVLRRPLVAVLAQEGFPLWTALLRARLDEWGATLGEEPEGADLLLAPQGGPLPRGEAVFHGIRAVPCQQVGLDAWRGLPLLTLPTDPADADAAFALLVRPALAALTGNEAILPRPAVVVLSAAFPRSSPVRRFLAGTVQDGILTLPGGQRPPSPVVLACCNCLAEIPAGSGGLAMGATVTCWMTE